MDWIKSIQYIKEAKRNNRLVIFVGSGVSANSGLPTWGGLIDKIAKQIGYRHCEVCWKRKDGCEKDCRQQYDFDQEEYLKIPEYYYQNCGDDKSEYYDFIQRELDAEAESNIIDDMIVKLMPHHIITTNYDTLLENSKDINAGLYTVIKKDSELLAAGNDHYIIKMHGDFDHPEHLVLKESDYINYEQTHVLITTYIKSLLIDHTFLFLGYSLSDSNLKLIIGWINYFSEKLQIENRPYNFLVQYEATSRFEEKSLELKNIHVVTTKKIQNDIELHEKTALTNPIGKSLYLYLLCIHDEKTLMELIPLEEMLYDRCKQLSNYQYIANEDFLLMMKKFCNRLDIIDHTLVIYDVQFYKELTHVLTRKTRKANSIYVAFEKADIYIISTRKTNFKIEHKKTYTKSFQLYLENNYHDLLDQNTGIITQNERIFYSILLIMDSVYTQNLLSNKSKEKGNIISLLITKIQDYLNHFYNSKFMSFEEIQRMFKLIEKDSDFSVYTLKQILSLENRKNEIKELIDKLEGIYIKKNDVIRLVSYDAFLPIKTAIYDLYMFCFENGIPSFYIGEYRSYFSEYIRSILLTYHFNKEDYVPNHVLSEIDVDIFIKYTIPNNLDKWMNTYHVLKLEIDEKINCIKRFQNFCSSFVEYEFLYKNENMYSFIILLHHLDVDNHSFDLIFEAYQEVLVSTLENHSISEYKLNKSLCYFIKHFHDRLSWKQADVLHTILFNDFKMTNRRHNQEFNEYDSFITMHASEFEIKRTANEILKIEDKKKRIEGIRCFYLCFEKEILEEQVYQYLFDMDPIFVYNLIIEKKISYQDSIQSFFIKSIQDSIKNKVSFYYEQIIECCVLMDLNEFPFDLKSIKEYADYSDLLNFMLYPDTFDYANVDLLDISWQRLFYYEKSEKYLREHKKQLINERLKSELTHADSYVHQYLILFQKLFTSDELRELLYQ